MTARRILIIDDDPTLLSFLFQLAGELGYRPEKVAKGDKALEILQRSTFDIVLTDVKLPGATGIDILRMAKEHNPDVQVMLMTAFASVDLAVEALKLGAVDFLQKPFAAEIVEAALNRISERIDLKAEISLLKRSQPDVAIIGEDGGLAGVMETVNRIASSPASVVIYGESGTGKELVARAIHARSSRSAKRMVTLNVAAIPDTLVESELFGHEKGAFTGAVARRVGLLELADGGTLFLDEIGDLSESVQVKLLRFLQERSFRRLGGNAEIEVDVRIISATHRNLPELARQGNFREDLFFRLEVVPIRVPALRDRKCDIPPLVEYFIRKYRAEMGSTVTSVSTDVLDEYRRYDWPGNVRELENVLARAVALAADNELKISYLDPTPRPPAGGRGTGSMTLPEQLERIEREAIADALARENGVKSRAARKLGIKRTTLVEKISRYGIE